MDGSQPDTRASSEQTRLVLILAGGAGTRFWPASREEKPKQFLDILGTGKSLLRQTYERSLRMTSPDRVFIVTNAAYTGLVLEQIPELDPEQVFPEPSRNNTAPCIAYASLKLQSRYPDAVCLVAPSDHLIEDTEEFTRIVLQGMRYALAHDALVTLGMSPTRPDTGYGYIQYLQDHGNESVYPVKRFTEKPDLRHAQEFIRSGDYLWNSGMFIWSLGAILTAFRLHAPGIIDILGAGTQYYFTKNESGFLERDYPGTEKISIDYAIMERAQNVFVIPATFGWSDLGTWTALYDHLQSDANGNIVVHKPVLLDNCHGTMIRTINGKLVVASGLQDFIVVNDDDVILIFPKDQEQEIKRLREDVRDHGLDQFM